MNNEAVIEKPKHAPFWKSFEWCALTPNRINRVRYLGLSMFWLMLGLALILGAVAVKGGIDIYLMIILGLILIPNKLFLCIRRIHDINLSAWWLLIALIPYVGTIVTWFVLLFWPGSKGENKFGEKPQPASTLHYTMFTLGIMFYLFIFISGFIDSKY